jgi:hypothetical protein
VLTKPFADADTLAVQAMEQPQPQTVESLTREIGEIVAERQALRARRAARDELEANRRLLAAAQARLSALLIALYLPRVAAA